MGQKFQFKILTGSNKADCQTKYDAIASKDPYTFYLFDHGGKGYLGTTPLFGTDSERFYLLSNNVIASTNLETNKIYFVIANCTITDDTGSGDPVVHQAKAGSIWTTDNNKTPVEISLNAFTNYIANYIASSAVHKASDIDSNYAGTETNLMTSAAIEALITREINAQAILNISFFKNVSDAHTVTQTEVTQGYIAITFDSQALHCSIDNTVHVGDIGIIFQLQHGDEYDESQDNNDTCVFVNLHGLINNYVAGTSNTAQITVQDKAGTQHTKEIIVEVNKSTVTSWESKILAAINTVSNSNQTYDPENPMGDNMSDNKFITESKLASILVDVLKNFVQYNME